jgi:hypothetical protein
MHGGDHNSTMRQASALPPIATVTKTVTAAQSVYNLILGARSRTVNIPPKMRQLMRSHSRLQEFWASRQGQQIYAVLLEEQPTNKTVPASISRPAPKMKSRAARA